MFWKIATVALLAWCIGLTVQLDEMKVEARNDRHRITRMADTAYRASKAVDSQVRALLRPHGVDRIGWNHFGSHAWHEDNRTEWFEVKEGRVRAKDLFDSTAWDPQFVLDKGNDLWALQMHRMSVGLMQERYMRQEDLTSLETHENRWLPEEYEFTIHPAVPTPWRTMDPKPTH